MYEYVIDWYGEKNFTPEDIPFAPVDMLEITWTDEYDYEGDARFMKHILRQEQAITPILSCPDDFDFSCIVIVAEVVKDHNKVIWKRMGCVDHSGEVYEAEKRSGILCHEAYTEEDWEKYGDNIALEQVGSYEWNKWIGENWGEELYRRRINYTYLYYQEEDHIKWFADCNFVFDREEYDAIVKKCYG